MAMAARQRGLEVTVADGGTPPLDKPCGEGLLPDGLLALQRIGVSLPPLETHRFRGIRFVNAGTAVDATLPSGFGLGVRRTDLHRIMVEHAERSGVRFLWGSVVTGLHPDGVLVSGKLVPARWTVGADGNNSRVRRWSGLGADRRHVRRFGFRRHFCVSPWSDFVEVHWGTDCQLYVTPTGSQEVCVVLISRSHHLRLEEALSQFPELADRLRGARPTSVERGAVSMTRQLSRVCAGRVALIGDASGSVDAITGEGLCLAFHQAELLATCLAFGNMAAYQTGHRRLAFRPICMARLMLFLESHNEFRARVMQAFAKEPRLFERLLALHVGAASPLNIAAHVAALGRRVLSG